MKQSYVCGSRRVMWGVVGLAVLVGWGSPAVAAGESPYLHMVRHRDANGNLVWPKDAPRDVSQNGGMAASADRVGSTSAEMPAASDAGKEGVVQPARLPMASQPYTFRATRWGMSLPEVKTKETADLSWTLRAPVLATGEHRLGYRASVNGVDASLTYSFVNNRLSNAKCVFDAVHRNSGQYAVKDYEAVKAWIVQEYGEPESESMLWADSSSVDDQAQWAAALKDGRLTMVTEWNVNGTTIALLLNGGGGVIGMVAEFSSQPAAPSQEFVGVHSMVPAG